MSFSFPLFDRQILFNQGGIATRSLSRREIKEVSRLRFGLGLWQYQIATDLFNRSSDRYARLVAHTRYLIEDERFLQCGNADVAVFSPTRLNGHDTLTDDARR